MDRSIWSNKRLIIVGFLFLISLTIFYFTTRNLYQKHYFKNLSLQLQGTIAHIETDSSNKNLGALYINVIQANKDYVDQRDSLSYYYCILKRNKAVVFQSPAHFFSVGDTVYIDTYDRELIRKTNGKRDVLKTTLHQNKNFLQKVTKSLSFNTFFNS